MVLVAAMSFLGLDSQIGVWKTFPMSLVTVAAASVVRPQLRQRPRQDVVEVRVVRVRVIGVRVVRARVVRPRVVGPRAVGARIFGTRIIGVE